MGPLVRRFRKKPVEIEAMLYWSHDKECTNDILAWIGKNDGEAVKENVGIYIGTLEGAMLASVGDWIIKGVAGEFYPCKPEIFRATYEEVF